MNLCRVSAEELLRELFQEVWVPPAAAAGRKLPAIVTRPMGEPAGA